MGLGLSSVNSLTQNLPQTSEQFSYSNVISLFRELFAHCLAWPNAYPKFARTRDQTVELSDTRITLLSCAVTLSYIPVDLMLGGAKDTSIWVKFISINRNTLEI